MECPQPPQELTVLIAQSLSTTLVDLGESWFATVLSPINSVATVLVVGVKAIRMALKRIRSASYA